MNESFFSRELPKWPGLLVLGEKVTPEQAMEILIRTDGLNLSSNDRKFDEQLSKIVYGVKGNWVGRSDELKKKLGTKDWNIIHQYKDEKRAELGHIQSLYYLENSRIVSIWIGGPKGWCDWEGNIRTCNYNIGSWPSVEEVYNEWVIIAEEFPFLNLRAQLLDGEIGQDEHEHKVVVEFIVKDGRVEMNDANCLMMDMEEPDYSLFREGHERGCTIEKFKEACDYNRKLTEKRNNKRMISI